MKIRENRMYVVWICMAGFLAGILYANVLAADEIAGIGIFQEYFLGRFSGVEILSADYIWYIARIRAVPLFLLGLIMTAAVLKMGGKGLVLCLIALTPHLFFYAAGYLILLWYLFRYPEVRWNLSKTVCMAFLILTGFLLECYVNPVLMQMFVETLQ